MAQLCKIRPEMERLGSGFGASSDTSDGEATFGGRNRRNHVFENVELLAGRLDAMLRQRDLAGGAASAKLLVK